MCVGNFINGVVVKVPRFETVLIKFFCLCICRELQYTHKTVQEKAAVDIKDLRKRLEEVEERLKGT